MTTEAVICIFAKPPVDLSWSADDTCARTLAQLRAVGLQTVLLAEWFDVDRPEDLARLRAALKTGEVVAPRTAALLERP